jgi:hypothetical protein
LSEITIVEETPVRDYSLNSNPSWLAFGLEYSGIFWDVHIHHMDGNLVTRPGIHIS